MESINKLMIIAGEESGDLVGAALIKEMKKMNSGLAIYGIGGDRMKAEGMDLIYHINQMAFLGFTEVVQHIPFIKKVQRMLISFSMKKEIKTVVLIDYPGFNLNVASKFKKIGVKLVYYVSPQLWAWGLGRMKKIKWLIDKMIVVFPFEEDLYRKNQINVEFVGHPLIERINEYNFLSKEELYNKFDLAVTKDILLLMPGSRKHEVVKIFPPMIEAAKNLAKEFNLQIVTACSSNIDGNMFYKLSDSRDFKIIKRFTYDLMKYAKFGIIKSGTSTLEAGYFELPMVILYKTSFLTYRIMKNLIRVNKIGMANILLDENAVPELIQQDASGEKILEAGRKILSDENYYSSIKGKLSNIKNKLGEAGASARAAKIILAVMNES
ncbi:lipid-A-disaccharide synthase [bacterium BMS3Abin03]|nr:lipid-A-disaccharide synthase [bacterium BMS3Abin03]MCG6961143.1 lipid-A-disaccharide synthase [bacterium BMS3Abin03]